MKKILILLYTLILTIFLSCSSESNEDITKMFFDGLDERAQNNSEKVIEIYSQVIEKDSPTHVHFVTEKLVPLLFEIKEYALVVKNAEALLYSNKNTEDSIHYEAEKNYLYKYLLLSMIELKQKNVDEKIIDWVTNYSYSQEHEEFFSEESFITYNLTSSLATSIREQIALQSAVFNRDYGKAVRIITASNNYDKQSPEVFFENKKALYLSDIGKAILYGSSDSVFFARSLEKAAKTYPQKSTEAFMCHFYAGRLYEESNYTYHNLSLSEFKNAMDASENTSQYDNALWYYITTIRKASSRAAITALQEYASTWHDAYYFDDFLDDLSYQLLDNENYKGFIALYEFLLPHMSPVSLSKYAYISALLVENGYVTEVENKSEYIQNAYRKAYDAEDGSLYYRMMASVALNIPSEKVLKVLLERSIVKEQDAVFENILIGLLNRDYIQETYKLYMSNSELVSLDTAVLLSAEFATKNNPLLENNYDGNYYPESLRIASKAFSTSEKNLSKEDIKLLYPRYYAEIVEQVSEVYDLEEFIIYAIMRSESFFDHDVMSWAGAIGLTQLMPSTAGDVARKLKVKDYDLHNARQNIDFGMFYFDELIPREGVDNSILRALFSYNAGITNVRRWNREFPKLLETPALFLEKIPFAETREYGRKVLSAAVMYGLLYYDMEVEEVVNAIMN